MSMRKLEYQVRFLTPAFLGNAEQSGQWRTPPFKALLRQWWRVAYAVDHKFQVDIAEMRQKEGMLFGNAWLSHKQNGRDVMDHRKSLVRIRLDRWDEGSETKTKWGQQELQRDWKITHPEVRQPIGPLLYLGYGPLEVTKTQPSATALKKNAAIQAGESATFSLAVPEEHAPLVHQALVLMDRYGTVGGRSRNGWGSFALTPTGDTPVLEAELKGFARHWKDALNLDWPHSVGLDDEKRPLAWRTTNRYDDWKALMRELAIIKIGLRTQFTFPDARPPHQKVQARHWLSYPITTHTADAWKPNLRLPNSLRFKLRPDATDPKKLRGTIFHLPCLPPQEFAPDRSAIERAWIGVYSLLDELTKPAASRGYLMINDNQRREKLKQSLANVTLTRMME